MLHEFLPEIELNVLIVLPTLEFTHNSHKHVYSWGILLETEVTILIVLLLPAFHGKRQMSLN